MRKNQTRAGLGFFVVSALSVSALSFGATACDSIAGGKELDLAYCQAHPAEPACADYCMTHSGEGCPDGRPAVDAPTSCASNAECSGAASVCDVAGTKACVLCTATDHAACTRVTPVCSDDKAACRACVADAECDSGVCRDDGSCAAAENAIMVAVNGSGTVCTLTMPCTLAIGVGKISAAKNVLHIAPGVYEVNSGLTLSTDVTVTGRSATLDRSSGTPGPVVSSSAAVVLEFITVTGGHGPNGLGVNATAGALTMKRTTIYGNTGGGVAVANSDFKLENNYIVRNGNATSAAVGGVSLLTPGPVQFFDFNTVADNDALSSVGGGVGGVKCVGVDIKLNNSILANNRAGNNAAAATAQTDTICVLNTTANLSSAATIKFKNDQIAPFDYHVQLGSVAIDAATTASMMNGDFDGDARPQGAAKDQGADEYKP